MTTTHTPDTAPLLVIIIVNFKSSGQTCRCVQSIEKCPPSTVRFQVIVVDNGSDDESVEQLERKVPRMHIIENKKNVGFPRAVNQGILAASDADYFLILNPDTVVTEGALDGMVRFLDNHPETGAVGCRLLLADGTTQISYGDEPGVLQYITDISLIHPLRIGFRKIMRRAGFGNMARISSRQNEPRKVDWVMGACMMFPSAVIQEVGLMDDRFFMYSEDADVCHRIRCRGKEIHYLPSITLYHYHKGVSRRFLEFTYVHLFRSLLWYHQKHSSPATLRMIKGIMVVDMLSRIPLYGILYCLSLGTNRAHLQRIRASIKVLHTIFTRSEITLPGEG